MRWTSSYLPLAQNDPGASVEHIELSPPPHAFKKSIRRHSFRTITIISVLLSVSLAIYYFDLFSIFADSLPHPDAPIPSDSSSAQDVPSNTSTLDVPPISAALDVPPGTPDGWYFYNHSATFESPLQVISETRPYHQTRSQRVMNRACADLWIARGQVCNTMPDQIKSHVARGDDGKLDVFWTWINGSEPHLSELRTIAAEEDNAQKKKVKKPDAGAAEHHFRDHDELRFSMRSVYQNVPSHLIRQLHLFTSSLPYTSTNISIDDDEMQTRGRMGHIPTWLDLSKNDIEKPAINIIHHWENFKVTENVLAKAGFPSGDVGARMWRDKFLPTFNSLTIESQFPHIEEFKDTLLYLNDDYFITRHLRSGDFATVLYGPVFRIQRSWNIGFIDLDGWYAYKNDMEGEQPTLELSNWYLNDRFGGRYRSYIKHVARSMDIKVMREVKTIWPDVLAASASNRFRAHAPQIHIAYLQMYYTIERHREALIYSFLVLRADQNQDGRLTPAEGRTLLDELSGQSGFKPGNDIIVPTPRRSSPYKENLIKAGLETPAETKYVFTSADGYPFVPKTDKDTEWADFTQEGKDEMCKLEWNSCFPKNLGLHDVSTQDLFKRWMFQDIKCGDCVILALLGRSGKTGLEAFLPRPSEKHESDETVDGYMAEYDMIGGDTALWWEGVYVPTPEMLRDPRAFAVRTIQRYSYVLGSTPMEWLMVKDTSVAKKLERLKDPNYKCALLAINDDVKDGAELEPTDKLLKDWYRARWGKVVGWWERPMPKDGGLFDGWWKRAVETVRAPALMLEASPAPAEKREREDDFRERRRYRRLERGH